MFVYTYFNELFEPVKIGSVLIFEGREFHNKKW